MDGLQLEHCSHTCSAVFSSIGQGASAEGDIIARLLYNYIVSSSPHRCSLAFKVEDIISCARHAFLVILMHV